MEVKIDPLCWFSLTDFLRFMHLIESEYVTEIAPPEMCCE